VAPGIQILQPKTRIWSLMSLGIPVVFDIVSALAGDRLLLGTPVGIEARNRSLSSCVRGKTKRVGDYSNSALMTALASWHPLSVPGANH
jgi:hypothetical protein